MVFLAQHSRHPQATLITVPSERRWNPRCGSLNRLIFICIFFFGRCILDRNQRTSQKKRERERKGGKNRKKRKESTRAVLFSFLSSIMGFIFWPSVVSSVVSSVVCAGGGKWPPRAVTLTLAAHVWKLERGPSYWKRDRRRSNSKPTRMNGRGKYPTKKRKEEEKRMQLLSRLDNRAGFSLCVFQLVAVPAGRTSSVSIVPCCYFPCRPVTRPRYFSALFFFRRKKKKENREKKRDEAFLKSSGRHLISWLVRFRSFRSGADTKTSSMECDLVP